MKSFKKLLSLTMAATFLSTTVTTASASATLKLPTTNATQVNITESILPQASQHYKLLRDEEFLKQYTDPIELGDLTEELNVTLETTKDFPFTPENLESIRRDIDLAITIIHIRFKGYPNLNDIHILIDDTRLSKNALACYSSNENLIYLRSSCFDGKYTLFATLAHELTHKYLFEQLGSNIPLWFNEGIATQFSHSERIINAVESKVESYDAYLDNYSEEVSRKVRKIVKKVERERLLKELDDLVKNPEWINKNFLFHKNYPQSRTENDEFYDFNYQLLRECLRQDGVSLEKLIEEMKSKIKWPSLCNNHHFFDHIMKNGGDKVLGLNEAQVEELYKKLRNNAIKENILPCTEILLEGVFPSSLHIALYMFFLIYAPNYVSIPLVLAAMSTTLNNKISTVKNKPIKKSHCRMKKLAEIQRKRAKSDIFRKIS